MQITSPKQRMKPRSLNIQSGIALGPILFIIAILAVFAAAIAAGSGGFNASTSTESAKAMAQNIVTLCDDYQRAQQRMKMENGCDENHLDWTPPAFPDGATWTNGDYTGGNGTNRAGNGQCAFFDPRGGNLIFKQVPTAALMTTLTGTYATGYTNDGGANEDVFAGYPFFIDTECVNGLGTCPLGTSSANAAILMIIYYLNYATCKQINNILGINVDPNSTFTAFTRYVYGPWGGSVLRNAGDHFNYVAGGGLSGHPGLSAGCASDFNVTTGGYISNLSYAYFCTVMIR